MSNKIDLIYLRKSRADNADEPVEETLARHEQMLQECAVRLLGHRIEEKNIYREVVSGETIEARPMIKKVLQLMEQGMVSRVLVVDPQRLSRGDLIDCGTISNTFRYTDTLCCTPVMTYDFSVKHERKFFEAELMRGGEYLEYTKEILYRGRLLSVSRGNFIGSVAPYGYKKVTIGTRKADMQHTLEIVPEEAECIKVMFELYTESNIGFAALASELDRLGYKPRKSKHWNPAALKDMIENPVYIGKVRWDWRKTQKNIENGTITYSRPKSKLDDTQLYDGLHEAIVSEELFQKAQQRKGLNPCLKKNFELTNPYSGILYCQCGRSMSLRNQMCRGVSAAAPRLVCNQQRHCNTSSCCYSDFEQYVIDMLTNCIEKFKLELENSKKLDTAALYNSRVEQLNKELRDIETLEEEQYDLLESKIYTREVFLKRHEKLLERKNDVLMALENIESEKPAVIDYAKKIEDFTAALTAITQDGFSAAQKNQLLKQCVSRIEYGREPSTRFANTPFFCDVTLRV